MQIHSLRSADPSRRNERQEQSEGKIFILRILALRAPVFKSRCSRSPCCCWYLLDLMRFLSSCSEQLAGTLFTTKRYHQQPTQPRLVYSALGGRKCGRIPRTQPAFEDTGSQGQDPQNIYSGLHRLLLCFSLHRKDSALHRLCLCTNAPRMPSLCVLRLVGRVHHVAGGIFWF